MVEITVGWIVDFVTTIFVLSTMLSIGLELTEDEFVWSQHAAGEEGLNESTLTANHCDATDAGEIAQNAGVQTLVLTHIMPYRDLDTMQQNAESVFDGDVVVAEDGLTLTP